MKINAKKQKGFTPLETAISNRANERETNKSLLGFTLIELIVTIAIIGILSSVILFSVAQYINKSKDANVMGNLAVLVSSGEVYYNGHSSTYQGFCNSSVVLSAVSQMPENSDANCTDNDAGMCCNDASGDSWAACAREFSRPDYAYCVDSRGVKREISNSSCTSLISACPSSSD